MLSGGGQHLQRVAVDQSDVDQAAAVPAFPAEHDGIKSRRCEAERVRIRAAKPWKPVRRHPHAQQPEDNARNLRYGWGSLILCCQDAYSLRPSGWCRRLVTVPCAARAADGLALSCQRGVWLGGVLT